MKQNGLNVFSITCKCTFDNGNKDNRGMNNERNLFDTTWEKKCSLEDHLVFCLVSSYQLQTNLCRQTVLIGYEQGGFWVALKLMKLIQKIKAQFFEGWELTRASKMQIIPKWLAGAITNPHSRQPKWLICFSLPNYYGMNISKQTNGTFSLRRKNSFSSFSSEALITDGLAILVRRWNEKLLR